MLKTILSVAGKPGLYKLVSNSKNMIIVESLVEKKKLPIYARDKVVSLGDVSIYTDEGEAPLKDVFVSIKQKENGARASINAGANPEDLKKYLEDVLPTFDKERVYPTDIKKMIGWYNILIDAAIDFEQEDVAEEAVENEEAKEPKAPAKKTEKPKAPKAAAPKATSSSKAPKAAAPRKAK